MKRRNVLKLLGCLPFVGKWFKPKRNVYEILGKPVIEYDGVPLETIGEPQIEFGKYDDEYWKKNLPGIKKWSCNFEARILKYDPGDPIAEISDINIDEDGIHCKGVLNENGVLFFENMLKDNKEDKC